MTTTKTRDNGATAYPVPPELQEAYDQAANSQRVRDAIAAYFKATPDATAEGSVAVRHSAQLAVAEERREALDRQRSFTASMAAWRVCPGCGGPNTGRTAWTALCLKCQLTGLLMAAEDHARELLDGSWRGAGAEVTRRELMALWVKEHPDHVLRPYMETLR